MSIPDISVFLVLVFLVLVPAFPKSPKCEIPAKKRKETNATAFLAPHCLEFQKISGKSPKNTTFYNSFKFQTNLETSTAKEQDAKTQLYIGKKYTAPLQMAQHCCPTSSGPDSAVHLHLKVIGHSSEDSQVWVLVREDRWFERDVKEFIYIKTEKNILKQKWWARAFFIISVQCSPQLFQSNLSDLVTHHHVTQQTKGKHSTKTR